MKLPDWTRTFTPIAWLSCVACLALVAIFAWWVVTAPGRANNRAAGVKIDATFANGRVGAAKDANQILDQNRAKADAIADQVETSQDAISKTDPAGRDAATMRELCKSPSSSAWPECTVFRPRDGHGAL